MIASHGLRLRSIRTIGLLLTALSLLVVLLSAYLRLDGAGLCCADWPACYGRLLADEPATQRFGAVRLLHRVGATLSLLLACFLVWQCWRRPAIRAAARPATLLLLLMLALSALGIWSADPRLTLVGFLNILGGLGLVTFSWRVVRASAPASMWHGRTAPTVLLRLGAGLLTLTVVFGALIGAGYAALACPTLPDCGGRWWPAAAGWAAVQPLATLTGAAPPGDLGGLNLHLLHRYAAVGTLLILGAAALKALGDEQRRRAAALLLGLLVAAVCLGALTVVSGFSLWLAIGHGVCAAALLASVATLLE